jgi:hypothetical protein
MRTERLSKKLFGGGAEARKHFDGWISVDRAKIRGANARRVDTP